MYLTLPTAKAGGSVKEREIADQEQDEQNNPVLCMAKGWQKKSRHNGHQKGAVRCCSSGSYP